MLDIMSPAFSAMLGLSEIDFAISSALRVIELVSERTSLLRDVIAVVNQMTIREVSQAASVAGKRHDSTTRGASHSRNRVRAFVGGRHQWLVQC